MARLPRIVLPGQPVHVVHRGNNRQAVFFSEQDYFKYLDTLRRACAASDCAVHAYVLMTNHIHLLVTPAQENSLSLMMQSLGRRYVPYINGKYQRSGTLWEGRYKSALVDSEQYLLACSRYIELNPVRAAMVDGPGAYRWSSYRGNALGHPDDTLTAHSVYLKLGNTATERQRHYRELFNTHVDRAALELIRNNTRKNTIIGHPPFQEEVKRMLKRRVMKHGHGGDRKSKQFEQVSSDLTP